MSEYDDTNRGAVFTPFDDQKFILQGKLNIEGKDYPVVVMQMTSKNGNKRLEVYQKMGALFEDKEKKNEKAPDYSGPLDLISDKLRIAGWRGMANEKPYMSLQVSEKMATTEESSTPEPVKGEVIDDTIPF